MSLLLLFNSPPRQLTMSAGYGTFAVTGSTATNLTSQRKLVADTGAFTLTGRDVTLTKSGAAAAGISDSVTDTNGTNANAHTPEAGGPLSKPATFQNAADVFVNSNKYTKDTTSGACIYYYAADLGKDVRISAKLEAMSVLAVNVGLVLRLQTTDDYYLARMNSGTEWSIRKTSGGTGVPLGATASDSLTAGAVRTVEFSAVDIGGVCYLRLRVWSAGTLVLDMERTDASPLPTGKSGFRFSGAASSTTGFALDDIAAQKAYQMVAAQGLFTVSGQDVTLTKVGAKTLTCGQGSFALNGQNVGLTYSGSTAPAPVWIDDPQVGTFKIKRVVAPVAQYAIVSEPAPPGAYVLTAGQGSFTLSGQNVTLTYSGTPPPAAALWIDDTQTGSFKIKRVVAPVSQYFIVATPPEAPGAYVLTAGTGVFTVTGQATNLLRGRRVVAATGAFTVNGQAVGLLRGRRVVGATGAFTLSGQATSLLRGRLAFANAGSFIVSGQALAFKYLHRLAAGTGTFLVNGQSLSFPSGRTLSATRGIFTLAGQPVATRRGRLAAAGLGAFTVNGIAVGLRRAQRVAGTTGSFTVTGNAAAFRRDRQLQASAASFVFTGNGVGLLRLRKLTTSAGVFVLTGVPVNLRHSQITEPPLLILSDETTLHTANTGETTLHEPGMADTDLKTEF